MFPKIIKFTAVEGYVDLKEEHPQPIKFNLPEWYKKLFDKSFAQKTVKQCMPFLDTLTTGYVLKLPQDLYLHYRKKDADGNEGIWYKWAMDNVEWCDEIGLNINWRKDEQHPWQQLDGSPLLEKNGKMNILKILNPWRIETPPGYSTLFLSPMNNSDDRFEIIPGIVDTDTYTKEVNFPIVINGHKYKEGFETTIKKGTPYVQVIPFQRESWKMEIGSFTKKKYMQDFVFHNLNLWRRYKSYFWHKKLWK
tara:strand:- start:55 stop:804 length:750 start_codon:yes stop_codon:yes gene_type:complete